MSAPKRHFISDDALLEAVKRLGSHTKAAAELGCNRRNVDKRIARLAKRGYAPEHDMTRTVPDGYLVKGVSTYYNANGEVTAQWVKSAIDNEALQESITQWLKACVEDLPKLAKRKKSSGLWIDDRMACYPIGDAHIGMRAWAEECGKDWDLAIAERVQCNAMAELVGLAPKTRRSVIVDLGDWFHYDSMAAVTPRSGHNLDADGRYAKMITVGIKVMRQCIESALDKHDTVEVICIPGNHNETGALFMSVALSHIYENEPRVIIDKTPALFTYFQFGKTLVGIHHGHTCKAEKLPGVMAADKPKEWGESEFRYWWCGHVHHQSVKEYPGVSVETFNTLAANDAYATAGGWRSRENMKCIVLDESRGEVMRLTVLPDNSPAKGGQG